MPAGFLRTVIYLDKCRSAKFPWVREQGMAKTKISSTDFVWIFHEELQTFDDLWLYEQFTQPR
jgi:hypothetical protein